MAELEHVHANARNPVDAIQYSVALDEPRARLDNVGYRIVAIVAIVNTSMFNQITAEHIGCSPLLLLLFKLLLVLNGVLVTICCGRAGCVGRRGRLATTRVASRGLAAARRGAARATPLVAEAEKPQQPLLVDIVMMVLVMVVSVRVIHGWFALKLAGGLADRYW